MKRKWLDALDDEDVVFIKRFVLAGGTLKELARVYGVSYPTVRLRLDRLIAKVQLFEEFADADPFERRLRALYADGRLDEHTFTELLNAHEESNAP